MKPEARWRRDVWRAFKDQGFAPAEIQAAMVMAAVAVIGTQLEPLSSLTGLSMDYVRKVVRRLRKQRILRGRTLRSGWEDQKSGNWAALLDGMTAAGILARFPNEKRSAAQRARARETFARGPRGPRKKPEPIIAPLEIKNSDPLYGLPEWEKAR